MRGRIVGSARFLKEGTRIAVNALAANWLRAALAVLGVGVGAGVVVTIAALINGVRTEVLSEIEVMGPENFVVMPFDMTEVRAAMSGSGPSWWDRPQLSEREIARLQRLPAVANAIPGFGFSAQLRYDSDWIDNVSWAATSLGWIDYTTGDLVVGRDFTDADVLEARRVLVITEKLAESLFGQADPIGKRLRVNAGRRAANERFTVVGIFKPKDNAFGDTEPNTAIVPYTTAELRLKARDRFTFVNLQVVPRPGASDEAEHQIVSTLRSMRGLSPAEENDFAIVRSHQIVEFFNNFTQAFFLVIVALSSVGMLVGGIGVVGIMLISVTERTREIGVRKALGATRREILWQFLIEASLLTAVGGATGLLVGWGLSQVVAATTPLPAHIPLWSIFAAVGTAAITGILFGLLPAMRASKLDPVDALRYE